MAKGNTRWRPPSQSAFVHDGQISTAPHLIHYHSWLHDL